MLSATSANQTNYWTRFPKTYREREVKQLASWAMAGESGSIAGLDGTGRWTFLNFLCHRPDVLQEHVVPKNRRIILVPVELTDLPTPDLSTLYRTILRAFYEIRNRFDIDEETRQAIEKYYRATQAALDPFLPQSALRELLLYFETQQIKIGLVMHYFVDFCREASPEMTRSMRGLRNSFKRTLFYLVSVPQEVLYLADTESIGPLRSIIDTNMLWLGPLSKADATGMVLYRTQHQEKRLTETQIDALSMLTGRFPSLIRVVCDWWLSADGRQLVPHALDDLMQRPNIQNRLKLIWDGLSQEEQTVLSELAKAQQLNNEFNADEYETITFDRLCHKGVLQIKSGQHRITGTLLNAFAWQNVDQSRGKIWIDSNTKQTYMGKDPIDPLSPIPQLILEFLVENSYSFHSHDDLIEAGWSEEALVIDGVTTQALYQTIRTIRKAIEPNPSNPQYLISRTGGYQFFPEGRPKI